VNTRAVVGQAAFRLGQWLETDAVSRARVVVGAIGDVTVDPNSRLRLTGVAEANHRLELQRGSLRAFIYAPPRLFLWIRRPPPPWTSAAPIRSPWPTMATASST